ncbi:hypothetical protein A0H81_08743 [Grifola frondosa]|uniref:Uncharacterized protein n=1 Tax=Grifola frondosa TaxID=5627 RepID=A0A1C7M390_GRIFR|nr:hypothetical protein A0H81_08743 [Grifola frondosa]
METETVERVSEIMEVEADGTEYVSEVVEVQGKVTERKKTKKCKSGDEAGPSEDGHGKRKKKRKSEKDEDKQERKRRKREAKEEKAARDEGKTMVELPAIEESSEKDVEGILALSNAKAEKRRRKEERRARKEEKRKRKVYSLSEVTANGEGGVEEELPRPSNSSHTVVEADASRKQQKDKNKKSGTSDDLSSSMKSIKKRKKMPSE